MHSCVLNADTAAQLHACLADWAGGRLVEQGDAAYPAAHTPTVCVVAQVLLRDKMNVLLVLLPLAIISHALKWPAGVSFVLALLPLCSLAEVRRPPCSGVTMPCQHLHSTPHSRAHHRVYPHHAGCWSMCAQQLSATQRRRRRGSSCSTT